MKELLISILSLVVGSILTRITDYFWLKSPKLNIKTDPAFQYVQQTDDGPFYQADCTIKIHNYSKNDAYGLEVENIVFSDPSVVVDKHSISMRNKSITDLEPMEVKFSCATPIVIQKNQKSFNTKLSDQGFSHSFYLCCSYHNQLGKKYHKRLDGVFDKENRSKFFTFGVV